MARLRSRIPPLAVALVVFFAAGAAIALASPAESAPSPLAPLVDSQLVVARKSQDMVAEKVATRRSQLRQRVRASHKLSRLDGPRMWVEPSARALILRRRAGASRILKRDLSELALLNDELSKIGAATARLEGERGAAAELAPLTPQSLHRPVVGAEVVGAFGRYKDPVSGAELNRRGLELNSFPGRNVRAPADGRVRYVGTVRGLGQVVLIDHEVATSILGRIEPSVQLGQRVERGAVVGEAVDRSVYVEIRLPVGSSGMPVDPAPLLQR